jgi:hypothetical protein
MTTDPRKDDLPPQNLESLDDLPEEEQKRRIMLDHEHGMAAALHERKQAVKAIRYAGGLKLLHMKYHAAANEVIRLVKFSEQSSRIPKELQDQIHQTLLPLLVDSDRQREQTTTADLPKVENQ